VTREVKGGVCRGDVLGKIYFLMRRKYARRNYLLPEAALPFSSK